MEKKYQIFERVLNNQTKSGQFFGIQDRKGLVHYIIEKYSKTHKERNIFSYIIDYGKWLVLLCTIGLILFSYNMYVNQPALLTYLEHRKVCIQDNKIPECRNWINPNESYNGIYRDSNYKTWGRYTNILSILMIIGYFPYIIWKYITQVIRGDIRLWHLPWRMILVCLYIFFILQLTWFVGNYFGSLSILQYSTN